MRNVAALVSKHGEKTLVGLDSRDFGVVSGERAIDVAIVATEDGFSPLGAARKFFSEDLGVEEKEIVRLARWNLAENPNVTLVALTSQRKESLLKGVLLAPCEMSRCYEAFATPRFGRPYRDFYYNVTYEAIACARNRWNARRIGISHLSASQKFHEDIAICNAEALAHFCDDTPGAALSSLSFVGCCIHEEHLGGIKRLNREGTLSSHRPISVDVEDRGAICLLRLSW